MHDIKHITPVFAVSPQITTAQLPQLRRAGFSCVICNRPDHEDAGQPTFADIKAAAELAGLEAHHIPIRPGEATRDDLAAFDGVVTAARGKVLAYCRSGGRAQSLFAAIRR